MKPLLIAAIVASAALYGCSSSGPKLRVPEASQRERVKSAIAHAEQLAGTRLRNDLTVSFADAERQINVRDIHGRSRKLWVRFINDGYRAAMNYRSHIELYTKPGDPSAWDPDVLAHEVGHTLYGRSKEEDHVLMRAAGFAF
jgi:hypothetical protein